MTEIKFNLDQSIVAVEDSILEISGTYPQIVGSPDQGFILALVDESGQTMGRYVPVDENGEFDEQVIIGDTSPDQVYGPFLVDDASERRESPSVEDITSPPEQVLELGNIKVLALLSKQGGGPGGDTSPGEYEKFDDSGEFVEGTDEGDGILIGSVVRTKNFLDVLNKLNGRSSTRGEYTGTQDDVVSQIIDDIDDNSTPPDIGDRVRILSIVELQESDFTFSSSNHPVPQNGQLLIEGESNRHPDVLSIFAKVLNSKGDAIINSSVTTPNKEVRDSGDMTLDWSVEFDFTQLSQEEQLSPGVYTVVIDETLKDVYEERGYQKSGSIQISVSINERIREDLIEDLRPLQEELEPLSILPEDADIKTKTSGAITDNIDANLYVGGKNNFAPIIFNIVDMKIEMTEADTPNYAVGVVSPDASYNYSIQIEQEEGRKQGSVSLEFEDRPEEIQQQVNEAASAVGLPIQANESGENITGTTVSTPENARSEYLNDLARDIIENESNPEISDTNINIINEELANIDLDSITPSSIDNPLLLASGQDIGLLRAAEKNSRENIRDAAIAIFNAYVDGETTPTDLAPQGDIDINRARNLEGITEVMTDEDIENGLALLSTFSTEKTINVEPRTGSTTIWGQPAILTVKSRLVSNQSNPDEEQVLMRGNVANVSITGEGLFSILIYDPSQQPFENLEGEEAGQTMSFINTRVDFDQLRLSTPQPIPDGSPVAGEPQTLTTVAEPARASTILEEILTDPTGIGFRKSRGVVNIINSPEEFGSYEDDVDPARTQYVIELIDIADPEDLESEEPTSFVQRRSQQFIDEGLFTTEEEAISAAQDEQLNLDSKDAIITSLEKGVTFYEVLQKLEKECLAEYWFDKDGIFHFGRPQSTKYQLDLITESDAGLETPPYRSVRVIGSKPIGRLGKTYQEWTQVPEDSEKVQVTATIGRVVNLDVEQEAAGEDSDALPEEPVLVNPVPLPSPVYEYIDYSLSTEGQIISTAKKIIQELIKKNASGEITVVGLPELELFDVVKLPNTRERPFGGAEYAVTKVTHELSGQNGFTTRIGVAGRSSVVGGVPITSEEIENLGGGVILAETEVEAATQENEQPPEQEEPKELGIWDKIVSTFTKAVNTETTVLPQGSAGRPSSDAIDRFGGNT
jgi:hypothetical protein